MLAALYTMSTPFKPAILAAMLLLSLLSLLNDLVYVQ